MVVTSHIKADVIILGCSLPGIVAAHKLKKTFGKSMDIVVLDMAVPRTRHASKGNVAFQVDDDDSEDEENTKDSKEDFVTKLEDTSAKDYLYSFAKEFGMTIPNVISNPAQDAPVSDRTPQVKDTNNPLYNAVFPLAIHRGARACLRVFKRHGIKFEVYSRGGWFSKDTLLGSCSVKLAPLETQVTIHEAFPLMDGRRTAGGALEVKLRARTPLLQQQVESSTHRWLVVDS